VLSLLLGDFRHVHRRQVVRHHAVDEGLSYSALAPPLGCMPPMSWFMLDPAPHAASRATPPARTAPVRNVVG
jgi:hypothetical protein